MINNKKTNISHAEDKILEVISKLQNEGETMPENVYDMPNLPFTNYDQLINEVKSGNFFVQRLAFRHAYEIFELVATPLQSKLNSTYLILAFGLPVISIILAIFYSWWWLLGIISFFFLGKRARYIYDNVILQSALDSELLFCFLYYIRQISVTPSDRSTTYCFPRDAKS